MKRILIANRGEIANRIRTTLDRMSIASLGIYTARDAASPHLKQMTQTVRIIEESGRSGYLDIPQIVQAAIDSGADAVHPGYGFLAENAEFAQACQDAGLIFIGPSPRAILEMGDKIAAREIAIRSGVPVVPGVSRVGMSDQELLVAAIEVGFPLLVKPAAGGGGKGLHRAETIEELGSVLPSARREAEAAFGDGSLFLERVIEQARHIEFQVVADHHGNSLSLGERECSVQRRHQKVIEETPSLALTSELREEMAESALRLVQEIGYTNLGTVEFLLNNKKEFFFIEMNTRLQVEHRVTEQVTGLDLVETQIRIASGEHLADVVPKSQPRGHAIEARIYAENPRKNFLPTGGRVLAYREPSVEGVLIDSSIDQGIRVGGSFDPMLAKVSALGQTREESIARLDEALGELLILGLVSNIEYLRSVLRVEAFKSGAYDTGLLESLPQAESAPPPEALGAFRAIRRKNRSAPWSADGWRSLRPPMELIEAFSEGVASLGESQEIEELWDAAEDGEEVWLHHPDYGTWNLTPRHLHPRISVMGALAISSPMPGVIVAVKARDGESVRLGDPLIIVEAMKMEHVLQAPCDGEVTGNSVEVGQRIKADQVLMTVVADVE
jgi:acetyl-CoA/propionyl-CoA carboxylase, biotin carboxylase, biotin carboxyl carrier protein